MFLRVDEYMRLLNAAAGNSRDYAILQLFLQTGIRVAELAGLPRQVVVRARQVLSDLEGQRPLERPPASAQLSLPLDHPVVSELKQLDLERLSPREALEKLYAWQGRHAAP